MKARASERRISRRLQVTTPLRVRVWKSGSAQRRTESVNISKTGAFFATDLPIAIGSAVGSLLKMPEELTGNPEGEGGGAGRGVRQQPADTLGGKLGVGV